MSTEKPLRISLIACEGGSGNGLWLQMRLRNLASILLRHCEVELIVPVSPSQADPRAMLGDLPVVVRRAAAAPYPRFVRTVRDMRRALSGDVVYALKLRPGSFGVGLLNKAMGDGRPLLLDIDDWETYQCYPWSRYWAKSALFSLPRLRDPNSFLWTWAVEPLARRADQITVVSRFFQRRYGGTLLPNGCDTDGLDPRHFDRERLRREREVTEETLIMFVGTVTPDRGVRQIIEAVRLLGRPNLRLVAVGPPTDHLTELQREYPEEIRYWGHHPQNASPQFLAMADLVVLPQSTLPLSAGQMPMKLFEAMAMELPVVAAPTADIAEVLAGCGRIATSNQPEDLAREMEWLLCHPSDRRALGRAARERCVSEHSWRAMEQTLLGLLTPYAPDGSLALPVSDPP